MSIYRLSFQTRGEEGNGHRGSNWEPTSFRHSLLPRSCTQREITRTWCHVVQRVTLYSVCLLHSGPRQHATTDVEGEEREKKRNVNDGVIVCLHVTHVVSGKVLWRHAFSSAISCTCPSTCYLHTPGCTFKSADTPTAQSSPLPPCATRKTTTMLTSDPRSPFPSRPFCFIFFFFLLRRWKCYLSAGVQGSTAHLHDNCTTYLHLLLQSHFRTSISFFLSANWSASFSLNQRPFSQLRKPDGTWISHLSKPVMNYSHTWAR